MANLRARLVAAALATAGILPLAVQSARAEEPTAEGLTQEQKPNPTVEPAQAPAQAPAQSQAQNPTCPGNPDAIGTSRVLPIDFSEYQQLGRMQYPDSLPLNDKEVVLTFDDGPLPPYTDRILDILAAQCVKATFFMVGEMARSFPTTVRRVYEDGHTIGTHSDHHPFGIGRLPIDRMRAEIDDGIADVSAAFGGDSRYLAPFFRIPGLDRSDLLESELAERGLIIFSADTVADDWHVGITPNKIIALALSRLEKRGKGILLLHDIHEKTAQALPGLLAQLKADGFRIVQVVPSATYEMAMARRPGRRMLASAMPDALAVDNSGTAPPVWPKSVDDHTSDDIVLPAPDVSTFEPDAGLPADNGTVQWPDLPAGLAVAPSSHPATRHSAHRRVAERSKRKAGRPKGEERHVARTAEHERSGQHERPRPHARAHSEGRHRADLTSRSQALAALSSAATRKH